MKQVPVDSPDVLERFHAHLEEVEIIVGQVVRRMNWPTPRSRWPVPREDLLSAGQAGLLDAARRYDPSRGATFRTFAYYRVHGAVFDEIRRQSPMPQYWYSRLKAAEAVMQVSEGEAAEAFSEPVTKLTEQEAEEALEEHLDLAAVSAAIRLKLEAERAPVPPPSPADPETTYERAELLDLVRRELDRLDTTEADIVRRYYFEEHRLEDIATDLGLSKSWVSRIHTRTIARISERVLLPDEQG